MNLIYEMLWNNENDNSAVKIINIQLAFISNKEKVAKCWVGKQRKGQ